MHDIKIVVTDCEGNQVFKLSDVGILTFNHFFISSCTLLDNGEYQMSILDFKHAANKMWEVYA